MIISLILRINSVVTSEEVLELEKPFSEEEVRKAIQDSYSDSDGALSPDGFFFMFYQKIWDVIKGELMALFDSFYEGNC